MGDSVLTLFLVSLFALRLEGDGKEAGLVGKVENFVLRPLNIQKGEGVIVEGISTASNIIQREERVGSTLLEKQGVGSARPPDNACLLEGERPAAPRAFGEPC